MEDKKYRVLQLVAENFKRLKAADVTPGRNAVVVSGKNKAGKTSLLDSIAAALGGKKCIDQEPIHKGAESGQILCVLGDTHPELLVRRVFTGGGKTALEITSGDGYKAPTPQAILDSLCTAIAFDPLSFTRMPPREQLEALRGLVGLDFSEQDEERANIYRERTGVNRDISTLKAQADGIEIPDDTPAVEVSVEKLVAELNRIRANNDSNRSEREKAVRFEHDLKAAEEKAHEANEEVSRVEARLKAARAALEDALDKANRAQMILDGHVKTVNVLEDLDDSEIHAKINAAGETNKAVAKLRQKEELLGRLSRAKELADELTEKITAIDSAKSSAMASVEWPVDGMSFSEGGVLYNDLPFSQASGAEQLAVSFAMSAAAHPQLRVAIVRDASLLDEDQMKIVSDLAEKYDTQVWLEVVDTKAGACGILIEDGVVIEGGSPATEEPLAKPKKKRAAKPKAPKKPDVFQEQIAINQEADTIANDQVNNMVEEATEDGDEAPF